MVENAFSVVIVTKNITPDILPIFEQCLISVSSIDDVWVVSSDNDNDVEELCSKNNVNYIHYVWDGKYPKKRGWCLENLNTKNDWIFFLDADEMIFPDLIEEIKTTINQDDIKDYAGFFTKSSYIWDGQPLKHGLKNNKIVLLNKKRIKYPVIDDLDCVEMGEIEGHYQPVPINNSYKIGVLKTVMSHHAFTDYDDWNKRHEKYANWESYMINHNLYPAEISLFREYLKQTFRKMPFRPLVAFLHSYILKLGILDGKSGFLFAKTRYNYYQEVQKKL